MNGINLSLRDKIVKNLVKRGFICEHIGGAVFAKKDNMELLLKNGIPVKIIPRGSEKQIEVKNYATYKEFIKSYRGE